ncbi:hypothetical protein [Kribbella sp. NPDC048915]|uniref:hypothetical protein n=1 Tax=Kribbella sp. NPDC048915 TaxID=3155148 RepID=UPI0033CE5843
MRANWPIGPVCDACYQRRKRQPRPCVRCNVVRVLVGSSDDQNGELCGPCCGVDIDFACNRCGFPGDTYADGACTRCIVADRVQDLLSRDDGTIAAALRPLADGLIALDPPITLLRWLSQSRGPKILARLASQSAEITHRSLDILPQDRTTRHVREMLVATGILPPRNENLARLELWLHHMLEQLPDQHRASIAPFAEWGIVRDARRRAARGRYTTRAATADRADIRTAAKFLAWLDNNQLDLAGVSQAHVDHWLTTHPTLHRSAGAFLRWTTLRRLTGVITVPARRPGLPSRFLSEQQHHQQLKRCLNDETLPLAVRIAGTLTGLYALPISWLAELTIERFHRDTGSAYLTIGDNPVLLPPRLAELIERQIERAVSIPSLRPPDGSAPAFLLPGRPPTRPISEGQLQASMRRHGLAIITARNTAMLEAVADLPPIVVSDLFGISPRTAYRWAQYAQVSWTDYLAATPD